MEIVKKVIWSLIIVVILVGIMGAMTIPAILSRRDGVIVNTPKFIEYKGNSKGIVTRYYNGVEYIIYQSPYGVLLLNKK